MNRKSQSLLLNDKLITFQSLEFEKRVYANDAVISPIIQLLEKWWNDEYAIEFQTSGSTGDAKKIRIPKDALEQSANITNTFFNLQPNSHALLCLPVGFIAGSMMVIRALVGQFGLYTVSLSSNPFAESFSSSVVFAACTPMQVARAFENETSRKAFQSVNTVIIGGGEISASLEKQIQECKNRVFATYGMTETITHIAIRAVNGPKASDKFTVLQGFTVTTDERGCLVISAPHIGTVVTNDKVELGGNTFTWLGRADSVINSGGIKFSPEEMEKELEGKIRWNYIISAIADEQLGQRLVLVIEATELSQSDEKQLMQLLANTFTGHKKISAVRKLGDFPRTPTGKIKRNEILINLGKNQNT